LASAGPFPPSAWLLPSAGASPFWDSGWPPSASAVSWSPLRLRARLGRRLLRRRPELPSSSSPGPAPSPGLPAPSAGAAPCDRPESDRLPSERPESDRPESDRPESDRGGSERTGSGNGAGGWNRTTGGGWNTAAGTLGAPAALPAGALTTGALGPLALVPELLAPVTLEVRSPLPRPPAAWSLESLSYSSLSSIRAISSQAPGRAVSRSTASRRWAATHPHAARELFVNVGPGRTALAVLSSRGHRAGSTAPGLDRCLHGYGSRARPRCRHDATFPASRACGP
jgi:hypothetical protein